MSRKTAAMAPKPALKVTNPKVTKKLTKNVDLRVRRTRDALGDALITLIQEKPFETITVQQVLDRADVGRSTFYTHYRDKDDLFLSDLEDFLEMMSSLLLRSRETSDRVAPVRELFAHVAEMRHLHAALVAADKMRDFLELGQEYFARAIDQRLAELPASSSIAPKTIARPQRSAMAHAFAGALLSLMSWWINHGATASPEAMDDLYHQMVWSGANMAHISPLIVGREKKSVPHPSRSVR